MGKLLSILLFICKLGIVGILTYGSMLFAIEILALNPMISPGFIGLGMILSFIFFGSGLLVVVFKNSWSILKYSGPLGLLSIAGVYGVSMLYTLPASFALSLSDTDAMCYTIIAACFGLLILDYYSGWITGASHQERISFKQEELERDEIESLGTVTGNEYIGAIEIISFPESHLAQENTPEERISRIETTEKIIRGLRLADIPFALRIESIDQKIKIFYLTWATNKMLLVSRLDRLESTLRIHLSKFGFQRHISFNEATLSPQIMGVTGQITGEPMIIEESQQRIYCLETVVDVLKTIPNGIVQIFSIPTETSWSRRQLLKRQVDKERKKSQVTIARPRRSIFSGTSEQSFTQVDHDASSRLAEYERTLRRHEANDPVKLAVNAVCWDEDEQIAKRNVKILIEEIASTIVPASKTHDFDLSIRKGQQRFRKLLKGKLVGKATLLIPEEAAVFLVMPKRDIGISVVDDLTFLSNPGSLDGSTIMPSSIDSSVIVSEKNGMQSDDSVILGYTLDNRGKRVGMFKIPKDDLTSHIGVWGDIGRGKTTTAIKILIDLWKMGVNWLVLLPSKNEDYTDLIRAIPNLRVFTPGNETLAKLRINPYDFAEGVTVNEIINRMMHIYVAAFPCYGMIKEYLEDIIEKTFERLGWDRTTNTRGLTILPSDFLDTVPLLELNYSTRGNQDFEGALLGRLRKPAKGALFNVFNTLTGMSIEELVSAPTLIIMTDLKDKDEKSLFTFLLTENIATYFESRKKIAGKRSKGLQFMLVLEEAHRLLAGAEAVQTDEGHSSYAAAIESILQTMQEGRSSGLGVMTISQRVNQLPLGAVELPLTQIVHGKASQPDRELLGYQMNCTPEQVREIGALPRGHAVVKAVNYSKPVRVQIIPPFKELSQLGSEENIIATEIKQHMEPVYKANPHFEEGLNTPSDSQPRFLLIGINCNLNLNVLQGISILSQIELWNKLEDIIVKQAYDDNPALGAIYLIRILEKLVTGKDDLSTHCDYFVWHLLQKNAEFEEAYSKIRKELTHQLGLTCAVSQFERTSLEWFYERMSVEAQKRIVGTKFDTAELKALLEKGLQEASEEHERQLKAAEEAGIDLSQLKSITPELEIRLKEFVSRKRFATNFRNALEQARAGDFKPLTKMLITIIKILTPDLVNKHEVIECLVSHGLQKYGTPSDSELVKQIYSEVNAEMSA
jgi:hypothetical protein